MSHAIVMGGSIAGLCAAAALAKRYDRVTVLERDPNPGFAPHKGVPQANHSHALLSRGQQIMHELFPGAFERIAKAGAVRQDAGLAFRVFKGGNWFAQSKLGVDAWFQSRTLLEYEVRVSLEQNAKVEVRYEAAIDQPILAKGRVVAVRLRDGSLIPADLVVDATGRGSRTTTWLQDWGYRQVREQRIRLGLGYVSGMFQLPEGEHLEMSVGVAGDAPKVKRGGAAFPIEGGRVMISLYGYHGDHAPVDLDGFRAYARSLLRPAVAEIIERSTLVGTIKKFTIPEQIRRCYGARRSELPAGYIVVGDAMCSLDPVFGQGMLVAALQAELLATHAHPQASTQRLQRKLLALTTLPFEMTAAEAHQWPEASGWKPVLPRLRVEFGRSLFAAAGKDAEVCAAMFRAMHFIAPQTALMRPRILWRILTNRRIKAPAILAVRAPFVGEANPAPSRSWF